MTASQLVVMPEHGSLELEPLPQEGQGLNFAFGLVTSLVVDRERRYILNIPHIGARCDLLVSVDFLLLVAPLRQRCSVRPHCDLARVMDELEVTGDTLEFLALLTALDADFEQGILEPVTVRIRYGDSSELLVGGVVWGSDVVRQEYGIGDNVAKTNEVMVLNMVSQLLIVFHRENLPIVVGIIVGVSSNLLTLAGNTTVVVSKRIVVLVTVKVRLGLLVSQSNRIVVVNCDSISQHDVVTQRLLEFGRHEIISRSRAGKNREVNLEPEEVEDEGHDD